MKKCPYCAEEIQDDAVVCRYCGRTIEIEAEQVTTAPNKRSWLGLMGLIGGVLILIAGAAWYYFYGPCGTVLVSQGIESLNRISSEWSDTVSIANSTSRIALSGPMLTLQSILQETQELELPSCLEGSREMLVESMEFTIDAFIAFMGEDESSVSAKMVLALNRARLYHSRIDKIKECVPFCSNK